MISPLAEMTAAELAAKEQIIERGKKAFVDVGTALAEIRDRRGYRFEFKTFEDYCRSRWEWDKDTAYKYIDATIAVRSLPSEMSTRVDVSHARELARLTKSLPSPLYRCPCGEEFPREVWHCPLCEHHWTMDRKECGNCHAGKQKGAPVARLVKSANGNGDKRKKEIDHAAVREVASAIDFTKATVKQVAAAVDAKLKTQRQAKKQNELAAKAEAFMLQDAPPAPSLIRIINEDARWLSQFVTMDIDLVFTSPPYNVGMDYRTHNDSMTPEEYRDLLITVFRECFKVMKPGARIGVNVPFGVDRDPYSPRVPLIYEVLTKVGFTLIGQTIWDKGQQAIANSTAWGSYASPTAPRFRDRCEAIVWGYKILPALEIPKGANSLIDGDTFRTLAQDYWHVPPASNPNHPAVFPPALAENAIRFFGFEGCHVLDPFAGVGSVGIAAKKLNCRASLVEIDAAYCAIAQENLK